MWEHFTSDHVGTLHKSLEEGISQWRYKIKIFFTGNLTNNLTSEQDLFVFFCRNKQNLFIIYEKQSTPDHLISRPDMQVAIPIHNPPPHKKRVT